MLNTKRGGNMACCCKLLGEGQNPGSDTFVLAAVHIDLITFL